MSCRVVSSTCVRAPRHTEFHRNSVGIFHVYISTGIRTLATNVRHPLIKLNMERLPDVRHILQPFRVSLYLYLYLTPYRYCLTAPHHRHQTPCRYNTLLLCFLLSNQGLAVKRPYHTVLLSCPRKNSIPHSSSRAPTDASETPGTCHCPLPTSRRTGIQLVGKWFIQIRSGT